MKPSARVAWMRVRGKELTCSVRAGRHGRRGFAVGSKPLSTAAYNVLAEVCNEILEDLNAETGYPGPWDMFRGLQDYKDEEAARRLNRAAVVKRRFNL